MPEYRAIEEIYEGRVRAYNVGDPVPAANVKANGYVVGEQVEDVDAKTEDKTGDKAVAKANAEPAVDELPPNPPAQPLQAEAPSAAGKRLPKPAPSSD